MIDVYKAIELYKLHTHEIVGAVFDIGHSFVISSIDETGEDLDTSPLAINKANGEITVYFPPDHWEELDKAIEIEIPKAYR